MLFQLLPMPSGLSHPVWAGAAEALGAPIFGHVSIDLGATIIGLVRYLTATGILIVAAAVTIDRTRAEWLLYWLTGATTFLAAVMIADHFISLLPPAGSKARSALHAASALGGIFAATATIRSIERYETRRNRGDGTQTTFARSLTASLSGFAVCWVALIVAAPPQVIFAAGCGFATVLFVVIVRRFVFGPISAGALAGVAIIAAIAIAAGQPSPDSSSLTLRYAAEASPTAVSRTEQMMADNPGGTGAGTFGAILPIYRGSEDAAVPERAPTTAAQIAIEMGRPALLIYLLMTLAATGLLLRGALRRGRDSYYAIGAAGCAVTLTVGAFIDANLLGTAIIILGASSLGLGLSQATSRTMP
jgi:hypothetical protein